MGMELWKEKFCFRFLCFFASVNRVHGLLMGASWAFSINWGRSTLVGVETQFTMKHKPDIFFLLMESGTLTLILHFDLIWCVRGRGQQITVESWCWIKIRSQRIMSGNGHTSLETPCKGPLCCKAIDNNKMRINRWIQLWFCITIKVIWKRQWKSFKKTGTTSWTWKYRGMQLLEPSIPTLSVEVKFTWERSQA